MPKNFSFFGLSIALHTVQRQDIIACNSAYLQYCRQLRRSFIE